MFYKQKCILQNVQILRYYNVITTSKKTKGNVYIFHLGIKSGLNKAISIWLITRETSKLNLITCESYLTKQCTVYIILFIRIILTFLTNVTSMYY